MSTAGEFAMVAELGIIAAFVFSKQPDDFVISKRNTEDCWYPPTCAIMETLIPSMWEVDAEFTKSQAQADVSLATDAIFVEFANKLPQVYQPQCVADGYNATSVSLLANDAYAATVTKAVALSLDYGLKYRGIRQQDLTIMATIIGNIKNSRGVVSVSTAAMGATVQDLVQASMGLVGSLLSKPDPLISAQSALSAVTGGLL